MVIFAKNKGEETSGKIVNLDVQLLHPNPFQPRKKFDPTQMEELSRSIAEKGIIQPVVVRQNGERYEIVAGERRWRAAAMAGYTTVTAIIRPYTDQEMTEIALIENLQRADLNYFEEAEGYRRLMEEFHMTQENVAVKVGKSQPTVANKLRLLKIDENVKEQISELLTERHARALLRLKTPEDQLLILREICEQELNVKATEQLITDYLEGRAYITEDKQSDSEGGEQKAKRQTIKRIVYDERIYINTIKAALSSLIESGIDIKMNQDVTENEIKVTITIPRMK